MSTRLPGLVESVHARAEQHGFTLSCDPAVGAFLAALAAAVPQGGRILELGTGVGTGLAWLVHGLGTREDVSVVSVDIDPDIQAIARAAPWPDWVELALGDAAALLPTLGHFDLVFADAPGGKLERLDLSLAALQPRGLLVVDDMDLSLHEEDGLQDAIARVRVEMLAMPELRCAELDFGSGVILGVRQA